MTPGLQPRDDLKAFCAKMIEEIVEGRHSH
jgi:hypothetical protein